MDSLIIEPKEDSPAVKFDTESNRFILSGESRPEDAGKFYNPIISWLTNFEGILYWRKNEMQDSAPSLLFIFNFEYFNSTSAKYIMDIMIVIKKFINKGYKINVEWHYSEEGDDILDSGKEFSSMLDLQFNFVDNSVPGTQS
ncbi:MAG: DUF1987 domain-containing protein [Bacteroidota bacterium]